MVLFQRMVVHKFIEPMLSISISIRTRIGKSGGGCMAYLIGTISLAGGAAGKREGWPELRYCSGLWVMLGL
jgi:hypothetical protein